MFKHDVLDLGSATIRVLKVHRTKLGGLIQCTLKQVPLVHSYTCLSHTWGPVNQSRKLILLNEHEFWVREGLWSFLDIASQSYTDQWLWIDAICINQEHIVEKNHQVRLMAQIYRQAVRVLVWLGSGDASMEYHLRALEAAFAEYDGAHVGEDVFGCHFITHSADNTDMLHRIRCLVDGRLLDRLRVIETLPYWSRMWIVQEILLGNTVTLLYGRVSMPWTELACLAHDAYRLVQAPHLYHGPSKLKRIPRYAEYNHISDRNKMSDLTQLALLCQPLQQAWEGFRIADLNRVLIRFHGFQCSDPRDRIYGILGMFPDSGAFQVDYKESLENLYARSMWFFHERAQTNEEDVFLPRTLAMVLGLEFQRRN